MSTERCFWPAQQFPQFTNDVRPLCFRYYNDANGRYAFAITWDDRWSRIHDLHCAFEYHYRSDERKEPIKLVECVVHGLTGSLDANRLPTFHNMHTMIDIGKLKLWMRLMKLN